MTCIDNNNFEVRSDHPNSLQRGWKIISDRATALLAAYALRAQQKRDRAAFMNLVGKENWLYEDMGIHEGDVDWASRLPIQINAAQELEKIRLQSRKNL